MMAEARGARGARANVTAVPGAAASRDAAAAAEAADGSQVFGEVDPLSGAPVDPLGGLQVHGGKFGADGEERPAGDAGGEGEAWLAAGPPVGQASDVVLPLHWLKKRVRPDWRRWRRWH